MEGDGLLRVVQYVRSAYGPRVKEAFAPVGEEYVKMAREKNLKVSAEVLPDAMVAIYVRREDESEEDERTYLAMNGPGKHNPVAVLQEAIRKE